MNHPVPPSGLSPQAEKILDPKSPLPLKMMAASGMAPLPPKELVSVLYFLSYSDNSALCQKAQTSLAKLPSNLLTPAIEQNQNPTVLDGIYPFLKDNPQALETIILNKAVTDETITAIAQETTAAPIIDLIATNETRLLQCPVIIEKIYLNPAARMSTADRAVELAIRNQVELDGIASFEELKEALLNPNKETPSSSNDESFATVLNSAESSDLTTDAVEETLENSSTETADPETKQKVASILATISSLTISQKIRMAMLGKAAQRAILIRDSNKLVSMAVLRSPAITDNEVLTFSKSKGLSEEGIRYIASKREWTKHYQMKVNLVNNPRTPIKDALRFLNHLRHNDIKALERSRDVPGAIINAAKQLRKKRGR